MNGKNNLKKLLSFKAFAATTQGANMQEIDSIMAFRLQVAAGMVTSITTGVGIVLLNKAGRCRLTSHRLTPR